MAKNDPAETPRTPRGGGMWFNDVVFGGEQLEPNVRLTVRDEKGKASERFLYVVWMADITAENVKTSIGDDGTKAELVISEFNPENASYGEPAKYGTFASSIVEKIRQKTDGDLPAVVTFEKVHSETWNSDAFVMTFAGRFTGMAPDLTDPDLVITPADPEAAPY